MLKHFVKVVLDGGLTRALCEQGLCFLGREDLALLFAGRVALGEGFERRGEVASLVREFGVLWTSEVIRLFRLII